LIESVFHLRLVIEEIEMAGTAGLEQKDDTLRARVEIGESGGRIGRRRNGFCTRQGMERGGAKAVCGPGQKIPAGGYASKVVTAIHNFNLL
jgi:hypothetical protein